MAINVAKLYYVEFSPNVRRVLWHVLSIGSVSRDEPERNDGFDKAGAFLFRGVSDKGALQVQGRSYSLAPGKRCWRVDLRHPRAYL
jgi:hypothetical protein